MKTYLILVIVFCVVAVIAVTFMVCLFFHQRKQAKRAAELKEQLNNVSHLGRQYQYLQIKTWKNVPIEDEPKPLRGRKRLVDEAGHTKIIANMRDSERELNDHSHYNVREYKVFKKNKRKEKRANKDFFFEHNQNDKDLLPLGL